MNGRSNASLGKPATHVPSAYGPSVQLKDTTVSLIFLHSQLVRFLASAGNLHSWLFYKPVVVTSGNDGQHAAGSAHYRNDAIDLRAVDLDAAAGNVYLTVLVYAGRLNGVAIFDERLKPGAGHFHCERVATLPPG